MDLSDLRQSYSKGSFSRDDLLASPFVQFETWFREAETCEIEEPNAMCLATVDASGQPTTRIVLLKGFSEKGLTFYTNYESRKSQQMMANPKAAANFLWLPLQRQVNVIGRVERIPTSESLKYFLTRPFGSQLGAWVSPRARSLPPAVYSRPNSSR